jgi:AraC-like DNA-binding protein
VGISQTASDNRITVPAELLRPLLRALSQHGVAAEEALDCPGGRLSSAALMHDDTEIGRDDFVHAYGTCTCLLEQALCSPRAKSGLRRKAFELFFDFMVGAGDLGQACERAAEFNSMMEERGYTLALVVAGDTARFCIDFRPSVDEPPAALIVAAMVFFYNVFSWATATPLDLSRIGLVTPRPRTADPGLPLLCPKVSYGEAENYLAFDAASLNRKVVRSTGDFAGVVDYIAYDPLFIVRAQMPASDRIRSMLLDGAQRGDRVPDSLAVADRLGISVSTLSRRLRQEHTTFLKLKSDCQREIAKQLLRRESLTMSEIAARLGFVDARSFRRAFIGWEGLLPSAFRAGATGTGAIPR